MWTLVGQTSSFTIMETGHSERPLQTPLPATTSESGEWCGLITTMTDSSTSSYMLVMIVRTDFIITMVMEASVRSAQVRYFPTRRARNPADVLGGILTTTATSICS